MNDFELLANHLEMVRLPRSSAPGLWPECTFSLLRPAQDSPQVRLFVFLAHADGFDGWASDDVPAATELTRLCRAMCFGMGIKTLPRNVDAQRLGTILLNASEGDAGAVRWLFGRGETTRLSLLRGSVQTARACHAPLDEHFPEIVIRWSRLVPLPSRSPARI